MAKKRKKLFGTNSADELIGTPKKKRVYGRGGDDIISTEEGNYKVWGEEGADTFETINGGKGYMKIMDFEAGDTITFCVAAAPGSSSVARMPGLSKATM